MEDFFKESVKPNVNNDEVKTIMEKYYGLKGGKLDALHGYDDLNFHYCPEKNCNPYINKLWPHGYVVKIMNSLDSKNWEICEAQNKMMFFLNEQNIPTTIPVKSVSGLYYITEKFPINTIDNQIQKEHIVRLLEFQPGKMLKDIPKSYKVFYKIGTLAGKTNEILKKFHHSAFTMHHSLWHLRSAAELGKYFYIIKNQNHHQFAETVIEQFIDTVLPMENNLEKGIIHGDINENNLILSLTDTGEWEISALLDFGDSHISYYLFEMAISICYIMLECKRHNLDIIVGAGQFIAGYLTIRPTFFLDYTLLKICICTRICQSLVLGLMTYSLQPENHYVLDSQKLGWHLLEEFWNFPIEETTNTWNLILQSYKINPIHL